MEGLLPDTWAELRLDPERLGRALPCSERQRSNILLLLHALHDVGARTKTVATLFDLGLSSSSPSPMPEHPVVNGPPQDEISSPLASRSKSSGTGDAVSHSVALLRGHAASPSSSPAAGSAGLFPVDLGQCDSHFAVLLQKMLKEDSDPQSQSGST